MHSMERLYNQLVKSGQPALEPLRITNSGSKLFWRVAFIWWKLEIQCNLTVVIIEPSLNCDNFGQTVQCFGLVIVIRALEETDYESQQNWNCAAAYSTLLGTPWPCTVTEPLYWSAYPTWLVCSNRYCAGSRLKVWEELIIIDKKQFLGLRNHCISLNMVNFRKQAQFLPFVLNFVLESGSIKIINAMLILLQGMPLTCQVHFINFNKL